jgi:heme/copper-type cytochrome/quinol oxidase subunit 2
LLADSAQKARGTEAEHKLVIRGPGIFSPVPALPAKKREVKNMVICFTFAVILLVIGIAFYTEKALKYIKGYQEMEEKEKNNIKIDVLCKNISILFFIAALIFGIAGFSEAFRLNYFKWFMIGWFVLGIADVIYIGKSRRFVHIYTPVKKSK